MGQLAPTTPQVTCLVLRLRRAACCRYFKSSMNAMNFVYMTCALQKGALLQIVSANTSHAKIQLSHYSCSAELLFFFTLIFSEQCTVADRLYYFDFRGLVYNIHDVTNSQCRGLSQSSESSCERFREWCWKNYADRSCNFTKKFTPTLLLWEYVGNLDKKCFNFSFDLFSFNEARKNR